MGAALRQGVPHGGASGRQERAGEAGARRAVHVHGDLQGRHVRDGASALRCREGGDEQDQRGPAAHVLRHREGGEGVVGEVAQEGGEGAAVRQGRLEPLD